MNKRKVTDEQMIRAKVMQDTGTSYSKIARIMDIPCSTLCFNLDPKAREQSRLHHIEYHKIHKKEDNLCGVEYRKNHKEEIYLQHVEYSKTHRPERNAYEAARRVLKMGAMVGATMAQLVEIKEIYRRAKEDSKVRCYLCGDLIPKRHRHVDHIISISKGGVHRPSNLAVACDECNMKKHDKMPEEIGLLL